MDGRRPADPVSDAALDRALDAALNVEPSPEFIARVRTRVAAETVAPPWWASWTLFAGGSLAAAALILVAAIWWQEIGPGIGPGRDRARQTAGAMPVSEPVAAERTTPVRPSDAPGPRATRTAPAPAPAAQARRSTPHVEPAPAVRLAVAAVSGDEPPFAEVIVSAEQQQALAAIVATLRRGVMPRLPEQPADLADGPLPAIQIEPITIEDVAIVASRQ